MTLLTVEDAPVAADTEAGSEGYSAFDRAVQVVGIVSPVLTIVLGLYFGARVGTAGAEAERVRAVEAESASAVKDKALAHIAAVKAQDGDVSTAIDQARSQFPDAF
jgi:hypothetical protein